MHLENAPALEMALYRLSTLVAALPLLHRTSAVLAAQRRDCAEADHALRLSAVSALLLTVEALVPAPAILRRLIPLYALVRLVVAALLGRYATADRLHRLHTLCLTTAKRAKKVVHAIAAAISDDESSSRVEPTRRRRTAAAGESENQTIRSKSPEPSFSRVKDNTATFQAQECPVDNDVDKISSVRFAEAVAFVPGQDCKDAQIESDEELSMSMESTTSMSDLETSSSPLDWQFRSMDEEVAHTSRACPPKEGTHEDFRARSTEADSPPRSPAPARLANVLPNSPVSEFNAASRGAVPTESQKVDTLASGSHHGQSKVDEGDVSSNISRMSIHDSIRTSSGTVQSDDQSGLMPPSGYTTADSGAMFSQGDSPRTVDYLMHEQHLKSAMLDMDHVSTEDTSERVPKSVESAPNDKSKEGSDPHSAESADVKAVKRTKSLPARGQKFRSIEDSHIDVIQPVKTRVSARFLEHADKLSVAERARALDVWTETQPKFRDSSEIIDDLPTKIPRVRSLQISDPASETTQAAPCTVELPSHLVRPSKDKVNASFVRGNKEGSTSHGSEQLSVLDKAKALQAYVDIQPKFRPGKETLKY